MEKLWTLAAVEIETLVYFEVETNGISYEMTVQESRQYWHIGIKKEGADWVYHKISRSDYQEVNETISFIYKKRSHCVDVVGQDTSYTVYTRGSYRSVKIYNDEMLLHESLKKGGSLGVADHLTSGMPGKISKVMVKKGDSVEKGTPLLIMEAMKMENEIRADRKAVIKEVHVEAGHNVEGGTLLISFES